MFLVPEGKPGELEEGLDFEPERIVVGNAGQLG
jgi:hypothetical protein